MHFSSVPDTASLDLQGSPLERSFQHFFLREPCQTVKSEADLSSLQVVTRTLKLCKDPNKQNLLNHFLSMKNSDGSPVAEKDVFFESMNVVGAGADTTAISTRAIIRYVCSSPRVYKKLQEEIDTANLGGNLSPSVQFTEGQNLPYFQAVIKEALRLFPAGEFKEYSTNETLAEYHKSAFSCQELSPKGGWRFLANPYRQR